MAVGHQLVFMCNKGPHWTLDVDVVIVLWSVDDPSLKILCIICTMIVVVRDKPAYAT